ncbi:hypothetical protein FACS189497_12740 [Betaproteobacteria bacterium]|nr:hypothetical protein FACS189497_12740 [Betaproteobacteria bacterium]
MKSIYRLVTHAFYWVGLFLLLLLSSGKYDWMREVDPSIPAGAIEDTSGDRAVVRVIILSVIIFIQLILIITAKKTWASVLSVALIFLALGMWGVM